MIRSVVHISLGRISLTRSVKAKVILKAFLLNFETPFVFGPINYDFEYTYMASDSNTNSFKRSPYSMILV